MPRPAAPLPDTLGRQTGTVTVALFSQEGCAFCTIAREHYLRPLAATRPAGVVIAEVELGRTRTLIDWQGQRRTHAEFARAHGVRFAPTVMFFDAQGRELAPAIVGLSHDFFGAYLDARIASALQARSP
jgi:thioredoxin-related protein